MNRQLKRQLLIYLSFFTLITLLLALGLSHFVLRPGIPPERLAPPDMTGPDNKELEAFSLSHLVILGLVGLLLTGLLMLIKKKMKKNKLFKDLLSAFYLTLGIAAIILIALFILPDTRLPVHGEQDENSSEVPIVPENPPPDDFRLTRNFLTILLWIIGIIIVGIIITVMVYLMLSGSKEKDVLDLLDEEAVQTRNALRTGGDFRDSIIRCYGNMCSLLQKVQVLERKAFMTVGDFERNLGIIGIKGPPVRQLSSLFETVRYGKTHPTEEDNNRAIRCLDEIRNHIRLLKKGKSDEEE